MHKKIKGDEKYKRSKNNIRNLISGKKPRIENNIKTDAEDLHQTNNNDSTMPASKPKEEKENKSISNSSKCQKCNKVLNGFELTGLSDCEHRFCADCAQGDGGSNKFLCPVCHLEYYWFYQISTGNKFFVGSFDPIRAAIVETVNQSKDLIMEFQNKIIDNFSDVRNPKTEMLTRLYVSLKHLQSTMIWEDVQGFKIELTDEDSRTMLDLYWALAEVSQCQFHEQDGLGKHNIIDDITDNIPYLVWLRKHLLKLDKYMDPCVLSYAMLQEGNEDYNEVKDE